MKLKYILVFLIFNLSLSAQHKDLSEPEHIKTSYTNFQKLDFIVDSFRNVDTTLNNYSSYILSDNPQNFNANLGYIGSPNCPLTFENPQKVGFYKQIDIFDIYQITSKNIRFFNTYTPFADFNFRWGSKEVEIFDLLFSQNIKPYWNATISYSPRLSNGLYFNQKVSHKNATISSWIKTTNSRYYAFVSYSDNSLKVNENGGLKNDTLFETYSFRDKVRAEVNLKKARYEQTNNYFSFKHFFSFGKYKPKDTLKNQIDSAKYRRSKYIFTISHYFDYQEFNHRYKDDLPNKNYYTNMFFDTLRVDELVRLKKYTNSVYISPFISNITQARKKRQTFFKLGLKHSLGTYKTDYMTDTSFTNTYFSGIYYQYFKKLLLTIEGDYIFWGFNENDFRANAKLDINIKNNRLSAGVIQNLKKSDLLFNTLNTNILRWKNNFNKEFFNTLFAELEIPKFAFNLKISYNNLVNHIYLDSNITPKQYKKNINYLSVCIKNHLKWKNIHLKNNFIYQNVSKKTIMPLPDWIIRSNLYYENHLFKKLAFIQFGLYFRMNNSFLAKNYMPMYGFNYLQADSKKIKIGNYPIFDLFLSVRIQRFRFFVKAEHVSQKLFGTKYYIRPHYPTYPRVFRLGVSWMFFN